ncbi:hypothetical protein [Streptomyces sp. NPDC020141]|uniref:hypothetical protein n=1 Tax=Streptomyces sp. NPDC020141 TaxID=3365065 RepID=UPI003792E747
MTGWHVGERFAERYAEGSAAEAEAWSVEKHVEGCGGCVARVSAAARGCAAGPVLADVRAAAPAEAALAESAGRVPARAPARPSPVPGPLVRLLWAAGPALRGSWLSAPARAVGGAPFLAYGIGYEAAGPLPLALSPALPPTGAALSYGRHADPMREIAASGRTGLPGPARAGPGREDAYRAKVGQNRLLHPASDPSMTTTAPPTPEVTCPSALPSPWTAATDRTARSSCAAGASTTRSSPTGAS